MNVQKQNMYQQIPGSLSSEWFERLFENQHVKIERIVSLGDCSPEGFWYDQQWDEWVLLLAGKAGLAFEEDNSLVQLEPGDHLLIPAHVKHRVAWTAADVKTIWLAVHIMPMQSAGTGS